MTCIYRKNSASGFHDQHAAICYNRSCGEPSTTHIFTVGFCANACAGCAAKFHKAHPRCEVRDGIYLNQPLAMSMEEMPCG